MIVPMSELNGCQWAQGKANGGDERRLDDLRARKEQYHAAIFRFARPVCYQDFPQEALPEALRDRNTAGIWRLIDGQLTRDDVRPS